MKDIKKAFKVAQESTNKDKKQKQDYSKLAIIRYIHGTSEKIANVLKSKQIKTILCPSNSKRKILDKTKDKVNPMQMKVIYLVPCSCDDLYIGESRQSIQVRLK